MIIITADLNEWDIIDGESIEDMVLRNSVAVIHDESSLNIDNDIMKSVSESIIYFSPQ